MLSIFPDLITFWLLAPFILRVTAGLIFIYFSISKVWRGRKTKISLSGNVIFSQLISIIEITGGVFLVLGLFTQFAALVLSFIIMGAIYTKINRPDLLDKSMEFLILLFAVLISLLFLGPGFFAIDLPL